MEFKPFTAESAEKTGTHWRKQAEKAGSFPTDVEQILGWTKEHVTIVDNQIAYGVFPDGSNIACGICELVITKKSYKEGWVKFIHLRLDPEIDAQIFSNVPAGVTSAVEAYIACVVGVLDVKDAHKATTIKVFGRTQEQMQFLTQLSAALQNRDSLRFTSKIEGRWLVLTWNEK